MKYYALLVLLFAFRSGVSQPFNLKNFLFTEIKKVEIDWPKIERKYKQEFTYKIVSGKTKVSTACNSYTNDSGDSIFYSTNGFHWVDINQDGFDDLIYSGACNGLPMVNIYLSKNNNFNHLYGMGGLINSIKFRSDKTIIGIFLEANACLEFNSLFELEVPKNTDAYKLNSITSWNYDTKIDTITTCGNFHFRSKNLLDLRKEPILYNDSINSPCEESVKIKGNIIETVPIGTKGILIKKYTRDMVTWCLIMVEKESTFGYGDMKKENIQDRTIGWVTDKELNL